MKMINNSQESQQIYVLSDPKASLPVVYAKAGTTVPREKCRSWCLLPPPLLYGTADFAHSAKTLFIPVSNGPVINALKGCPNASPPVPEQCFLAFSACSQYYHRFNSESSAILA